MARSQSIMEHSILELEGAQESFRKREWEYKQQISELLIKIESEKKRNDHLEQNYVNLPVNIEAMQKMKGDISLANTEISQLFQQLKDSQEIAQKYKKDLESFREFAFKEFKEKEFSIIELNTLIRKYESEINLIKQQSTLMLEQYEQTLKKLAIYKQKHRNFKTKYKSLKQQKDILEKNEKDSSNGKFEIAVLQKRIEELTQSREELAKKYSELEMKNQQLALMKSDFRTKMHKQTKTLTEMEFDFKNVIEGLETQKSEEVNNLLDRISKYEKIIKDSNHAHENEIANKQEEISKEKFHTEEIKQQCFKIEKDKQKLEQEIQSYKQIIQENQNTLLAQQSQYELKIEDLIKENNEKVLKYKTQIHNLEIRNKELNEMNDITRKSFLVGDSLFDELSELNTDVRDSKNIDIKMFQESIFKQIEETDSKEKKFKDKIEKIKSKNSKLKNSLSASTESIKSLEKELKTLILLLKQKEETLAHQSDTIQDYSYKFQKMSTEKEYREKEITRLKDQNSELSQTVKELNIKLEANEAEITKIKAEFEKNTENLQDKYRDKILNYKQEILNLNEKQLSNSPHKVSETSPEIEASRKLLKKNAKLKKKNESLMQTLKSKSETISKLQSKLRQFYTIPNVDENLNEKTNSLSKIKEENDDKFNMMEKDYNDLKHQYDQTVNLYAQQIEELIKNNQILRESNQAKHEIMIIRDTVPEKESSKVDIKANDTKATTNTAKVNDLKQKIKKIAEELNFSTTITSASDIKQSPRYISTQPEEKKALESEKFNPISAQPDYKLDSSAKMDLNATEIYIIKDNTSDDYSELLSYKITAEHTINQLELEIQSLKESYSNQLESIKGSDNQILIVSETPSLAPGARFEFMPESDRLSIELKGREDEQWASRDSIGSVQIVEEELVYQTTEESESEEFKEPDPRVVGVSLIDDNENTMEDFGTTEGSIDEDDDFCSPFNMFRQSLLGFTQYVPESNKIKELEIELSAKQDTIRQLQENIKDLQHNIFLLEKENLKIKNNLTTSDKKIEDLKTSLQDSKPKKEPVHDCILYEAKMTLLEAHNQRLETEIIVSKTNWGELNNSIVKDMNELERSLNQSRNDCKLLMEEREELLKRLNEEPIKKKSGFFGGMFKRKKRTSNIH